MKINKSTVRINGQYTAASSVVVDGKVILATGNLVRLSSLMDEDMIQGNPIDRPDEFIRELIDSGLNADIFAFGQKVPDVQPHYSFHCEWDSAAIVPISAYDDWFKMRAKYDVRKAVKRAAKLGVITKRVEFDDNLVEGIRGIYNETPIRQGRPFWHYGKSIETIKEEAGTYLDRSAFIGAYYDNELIGFIKMVFVDSVAATLHVISKTTHFDKKPINALIAEAVRICEQCGMAYLMYGSYKYGAKDDSLTEFKRRNGFEEMRVPRYYVPLTRKGALALRLGLHKGLRNLVPQRVLEEMRGVRSAWYSMRERRSEEA